MKGNNCRGSGVGWRSPATMCQGYKNWRARLGNGPIENANGTQAYPLGKRWWRRQYRVGSRAAGVTWRVYGVIRWIGKAALPDRLGGMIARRACNGRGRCGQIEQHQRQHQQCPHQFCQYWKTLVHLPCPGAEIAAEAALRQRKFTLSSPLELNLLHGAGARRRYRTPRGPSRFPGDCRWPR